MKKEEMKLTLEEILSAIDETMNDLKEAKKQLKKEMQDDHKPEVDFAKQVREQNEWRQSIGLNLMSGDELVDFLIEKCCEDYGESVKRWLWKLAMTGTCDLGYVDRRKGFI